jgi:DHA2 family multidrug resistance protein
VLTKEAIIGLLGALIAAIAVEFNDQVFAVSLPDIKGALGISNDPGTWLGSLYATGQVVGMALSTTLALGFTIRRFALFSFVLCAAVSLPMPFCENLGLFYVLRFIQGVSGGFIIPLLLSTGLRLLTPETRLYALAAYALTATFGPNISIAVAALWDDVVDWHFVFFQTVPLFTVAFVMVWYGMPQDKPNFDRLRQSDWSGAVLLSIVAFSLVTLLEQGDRLDWFNSPLICVLTLSTVIFLPLLVVNELRAKFPLFGIWLLKRRNFAYAMIALFMFLIISQTGAGLPSSFLQQVAGFRPIQIYGISVELAAIEVVMLPLLAIVLNRPRVDARVISTIGLVLIVIADVRESVLTSTWISSDFEIWEILQAIGQPMFILSLLMMSTNTIRDPREGPFAAALINSVRAVAEPAGIALVQLIIRWRGDLHSDRLVDQIGQGRFRVIQAQGLIPGNLPPLLPNGAPRTPGALAAFNGAVQAQVAVLTLSDGFVIFAVLTALLLFAVWGLAERTYPPRIVLAQGR